MITGKKITGSISRILLLAVYGVFFAIQLSSYIDPAGNVHLPKKSSTVNAASIIKYKDGISNTGSASKKTGVRLNRRFHPQPVLLFDMGLTTPSVGFSARKVLCIYAGPSISHYFLFDHSLRGPPVTSC